MRTAVLDARSARIACVGFVGRDYGCIAVGYYTHLAMDRSLLGNESPSGAMPGR